MGAGQAERCARLFGAAGGLLKAAGSPVYNYYEPDPYLYERTLSATRSQMGDAGFEEAQGRGQVMTFEQSVAYALEDSEVSPA